MKFIIDAHLPRRLALAIRKEGHDAIHTLDLANANKSKDSEINTISEQEQRIVITKDSDFVNSLLVSNRPYKLLLISTGNITNADLDAIFSSQFSKIVEAFEDHRFVELNRTSLIIHS